MLGLEEWLFKYQKMNLRTFENLPDKSLYYRAYDHYRTRAARFEVLAMMDDIRQVSKELVMLEDKKGTSRRKSHTH